MAADIDKNYFETSIKVNINTRRALMFLYELVTLKILKLFIISSV